jgi:hypothetical protein
MLKYEVMRSSGDHVSLLSLTLAGDVLMTSTSVLSRSDRLAEAFRVGGGASIAAIFFLFLDAQKLPKNPELLLSAGETSTEGLLARGGRGLPVFGST